MNDYEISIWEDFPDVDSTTGKRFLNERKIAVIGSNTMKIEARALSPNLVEDINGTHTFTFEMKTNYINFSTGETETNPFIKYLFNERKIKVKWQSNWYDFVIKKCAEDSGNKSITYTCTDLFINELSKNGYSLEFDNQLQNNIGTAAELATQVLEGSSWQYNSNLSTPIIQRTKGPVYEVNALNAFSATWQGPREDFPEQEYDEINGGINVTIPRSAKLLVFYDSLVDFLASEKNTDSVAIQFLYNEEYITDINETLVINGHCHILKANCTKLFRSNDQTLMFIRVFTETDDPYMILMIPIMQGISKNYTGEYLVRSRTSVFDPLLNRYSLLCKDKNDNSDVYEIATTEYINPTQVINLVTNPKDFTNTAGWIGDKLKGFELLPKFSDSTDINTYNPTSYIKIDYKHGSTDYEEEWVYNSALKSNSFYFQPTEAEQSKGVIGGISKGEIYWVRFRVKDRQDFYDSTQTEIEDKTGLTVVVSQYNTTSFKRKKDSGGKEYPSIFSIEEVKLYSENEQPWLALKLKCNTSVSAKGIENYALFIRNRTNETGWKKTAQVAQIAEVQFFKDAYGVTSYAEDAEEVQITPGQVSLSPLVKPVYKYYKPNDTLIDPKDLKCLYIGEEENNEDYIPQYNNYEKMGTISVKESNRFNILQTIAETFQAWVHFKIEHEDNGMTKFINGVPQKFVYFTSEIGRETSVVFEYGIDLKTVQRDTVSDNLATKIIVNPNSNEYATNGFCSIARSPQNYTRENFIINLDYFLQQHLIDEDELNKDLYSTDSNYIGYYYYLSTYNTQYDNAIDDISKLKMDQLKKEVEQETHEQYVKAAKEAIDDVKQKIMNLANTSDWSEAETYAINHKDESEISSLCTTLKQTNANLVLEQGELNKIKIILNNINTKLKTLTDSQRELLQLISAKHKEFNDKYGNYLMEGTWQDENYIDDTRYYLDAVNVAFTSSRPQVSYNINVLRLSYLEQYSSKVFGLGDICYIQDKDFFGYLSDGVTPYKERILVNKISSFFDDPSKDTITVQNYKTRFDDLFQRIAAATQSLQYSEGSYKRAANAITNSGTIDSSILKNTFETNNDFIISSSNQNVIWDETGITITDKNDTGKKTKIIAGGLFITEDGGMTWKNAISGKGISANILTAGTINTNEISIYNGNTPSFRWDKNGLTAYEIYEEGSNIKKFVRFDKFGIYGYHGTEDYVPESAEAIKTDSGTAFGLTWDGFFLKASRSYTNQSDTMIHNSFEISSEDSSLTIYSWKGENEENKQVRVRIGLLNPDYYTRVNETPVYGMIIYDEIGKTVFSTSTGTTTNNIKNGTYVGGCKVTPTGLSGKEIDSVTGKELSKWELSSQDGYSKKKISVGGQYVIVVQN